MKRLSTEALIAAWWRPGKYEDPDVNFEGRLIAVQDAVLAAQEQLPLVRYEVIPEARLGDRLSR